MGVGGGMGEGEGMKEGDGGEEDGGAALKQKSDLLTPVSDPHGLTHWGAARGDLPPGPSALNH